MKETYSREDAKSIKVGIIISLVLLFAISCFTLQKSAVKMANDSHDYVINAKFGRTDGLVVGDKVMLSGIVIGKVTKAVLDDNYSTVLTLSIDNSVKIPADSSASIVSSSILGSKFISIEPGGDEEFLESNDYFSYTQDAMVINELLNRIVAIGKNNCGKNSCKKKI
ncbi:MAG: MlaD family protein [Lactobacillaceae bacterium]|nr:MlaD family protein [Lactobacillaceae bacterium]